MRVVSRYLLFGKYNHSAVAVVLVELVLVELVLLLTNDLVASCFGMLHATPRIICANLKSGDRMLALHFCTDVNRERLDIGEQRGHVLTIVALLLLAWYALKYRASECAQITPR